MEHCWINPVKRRLVGRVRDWPFFPGGVLPAKASGNKG
jgi:hypothetical protein